MPSMTTFGAEQPTYRIAARLYPERRAEPRIAAERPVTVRTANDKPIDAVVENLSRDGFAMSTIADLGIGSLVGLSVAGVLQRRVKIVRRVGLAYGCEFIAPLSEFEVQTALHAAGIVTSFSTERGDGAQGGDIQGARFRKLSYLARLYVLVGLLAVLWMAVIAVAWLLI